MTDKPWSCEIRVMVGGTEHSIGGRVADRDAALSVAAMAIDALAELLAILDDADAEPDPKLAAMTSGPLAPDVLRELWHWRIAWTDAVRDHVAVDHVAQSWTPTASDAWIELSAAAQSLAGLQDDLRRLRAPASALSDAELAAHMATRRPPGTPG